MKSVLLDCHNDPKRCETCPSCQKVFTWEFLYKEFLKTSPKEIAFIEKQRELDQEALKCQEQDWDTLISYEDAMELANG